jgi:hypothetical protein
MGFVPLTPSPSPGVLGFNWKECHVQPDRSVALEETGDVRCAYCRRLYPAIPEKNCGSCGAAEWETRSEFLRGLRMRNFNGALTGKDEEYLRTGKWS